MASLAMDEMKRIAKLQEGEGRLELGKAFGIAVPVEEDTDLRGSIQLDFLYDTFNFVVQKGFSWEQCQQVIKIAQEMLDETPGKTTPEAIRLYSNKCKQYQKKISAKNIETFTNYFFQTFMLHYSLYQYVFTRKRESQIFHIYKTVETPAEPENFVTGKPEKIWNYEQKIKEIDDILQQRLTERQESQNDAVNTLQSIYDELKLEPPIDLDKMRTLVGEVAKAHLTTATSHLKENISNTIEDLELHLQKSSLPKPQEMFTSSSPCASEENDDLPELAMTFDKGAAGTRRKSSLASRGPGSSLAMRGPDQRSSAASRGPSRTNKSRVSFSLKSGESRSLSTVPVHKKKVSANTKKKSK